MVDFCVYIMSNRSSTLYTGMTDNIFRRVQEHKNKTLKSFTSRYNFDRLVYFEITDDPSVAIYREKQIKGWRRDRKIVLIESVNPEWKDLSADLLGDNANSIKPIIKRRPRPAE